MKFLILDTYYPAFLRSFYGQRPDVADRPYSEQWRVLMDQCFGTADFYSHNLQQLGHEATEVVANCEPLQRQWAREHGIHEEGPARAKGWTTTLLQRSRRIASKTPLRLLKPLFRPILRSLDTRPSWLYPILAAQIRHFQPDVLLNHSMSAIAPRFMREMKPRVRLLVGQHGATQLPDSDEWHCYDLVVSSFPPTVDWFGSQGIAAELYWLGFEPKVLSTLKGENRPLDITFVGSFHDCHTSRVTLLEALCHRFLQLRIWCPSVDHLLSTSAIRGSYVGQAWGKEMYEILARSKITLNHHGDIAPYANNMRLFEATGVGTFLITDWKENLEEMFALGEEVVAYHTVDECAELIAYYIDHEEERKAIAYSGQQRTLREHTYYHRMQELVEIVTPLLQQATTE